MASDVSNFDDNMEGLSGMNHMLRSQLSELKSYLKETNNRLEFLETGALPSTRSRLSSYRSNDSRYSLGSSRSSRRGELIGDARLAIDRSRSVSSRRPKTRQ